MTRKEKVADMANRAMSGDQTAFDDLYREVSPKLYGVLKRDCEDNNVLKGRIGPSDLMQSVFKWVGSFQTGPRTAIQDAEAVLITVGRQRIAHYVRMFLGATRDRSREIGGEGVLDGVSIEGSSPVSEAAARETENLLEIAVSKLSPEDREWIECWSKGGRNTCGEMAFEFGTTETALRKKHERILKKLLLMFTEVRANGGR